MMSIKILSGLVSAYLIAAPCLLIDHSGSAADIPGAPVAHAHDDHAHGQDTSDTGDQEHCCEDLSSSVHTSLKQEVQTTGVLAVVPSFDIYAPYVHPHQRTALSRDGPLHERASQFAKTIVILC